MSPAHQSSPAQRDPLADRGSASVEVAILTPAFAFLVVLAFVIGRITIAQNAIDLAAHDAARAASIERTVGDAQNAAEAAALGTIAQAGIPCEAPDITIDTDAFETALGRPADVGDAPMVLVEVACEIDFTDLPMLDFDSGTVRSSFASPLDWYRSRGTALGAPSPVDAGMLR